MADQLASGFSLRQALQFSQMASTGLPASVAEIERRLVAGENFVTCLAPYLQASVYFQLQIMTTYGDLAVALQRSADLLDLMATQRKRLLHLLMYPVSLLIGMLGLLVTLKLGVLPQLQQQMVAQAAPQAGQRLYLEVGGGLGVILGGLGGWRWWRQQTTLHLVGWYLRWPVVGKIFRAYYAYYLTANLGQLLASGLSVKQMISVLQQLPPNALLHQLAVSLAQRLQAGKLPVNWLRQQAFIPSQLLVLLQKGQTSVQLARELEAYSQLRYRELVRLIEQSLALVQPILLTVVALLIVGAYLSMLLPMYANLQGVYQ
ncbi:type II secretion system F family protein [Levilactobacillus tujiorum]|uniref:type II secretion system F family protein n=1 Tax=Levilactobacillus tujiorum TaxID=2912243 RepID=UPI001E5A208C|nr:type II secretion system F family protein [Levilactobacillus tujiorum]